MSDHRTRTDAAASGSSPEERDIERLLERAGPRRDVPPEHLAAIKIAFRATWEEEVALPVARRRATWRRTLLSAAAALVVAVLAGWWLIDRNGPVAQVETLAGGAVRLLPGTGEAGEERPLTVGQTLPGDTRIETAAARSEAPAGIALRLAGDTSLRLDADTRIRLVSAQIVELERGALYVDSGPHSGREAGGAVAIRTVRGTAQEVGTQFEVRLLDDSWPSLPLLRVRVREGRVVLGRDSGTRTTGSDDEGKHQIEAGTELILRADGTAERRDSSAWGEQWQWMMAVAPPFAIEGRTLEELLAWVGRETGWTVRFEDEELAASATGIQLHGALGAVPPDEAPDVVLPGAGLASELADGILLIRRAAAAEPR